MPFAIDCVNLGPLRDRLHRPPPPPVEVALLMWSHLWPWRVEEEIPIGHITNGVHIPSWLAHPMHQLFDRNLGGNWHERVSEPQMWQSLYNCDPGELWETHNALKSRLLDFIRRRLARQCLRRHEDEAAVEAARNALDPNALPIGFRRRFAPHP